MKTPNTKIPNIKSTRPSRRHVHRVLKVTWVLLLFQSVALLGETLDQRVDVGGFELQARVIGEGTPAVVFEAGGGDGIEAWGDLPAEVARSTRVIVYDRAGLGVSDLGPEPRSARRVAEELHTLLTALEIPPPYLLVGHSLGGLYIRAFAQLHPKKVAGFVFLDVTTEGMHRSLGTEEGWRQYEAQLQDFGLGLRAESLMLWQNLLALEAFDPPPDRPAVVISGAAPPQIPEDQRPALEALGIDEERLRELQQKKIRLHGELVGKLPQGTQVLAEKSGHYVHHDESQKILQEILRVLGACRDHSDSEP